MAVIDTMNERVMTLSQAAKEVDRLRQGPRKTNLATLYRWSLSGLRGVVLETIQIGNTRCTSRQALDRFFAGLTARNDNATPPPAARRDDVRTRNSERAGKALEMLGA